MLNKAIKAVSITILTSMIVTLIVAAVMAFCHLVSLASGWSDVIGFGIVGAAIASFLLALAAVGADTLGELLDNK